MRSIAIEPWSEEAFAPFGQPIVHRHAAPLEDFPAVFDRTVEAVQPYCGVLRIEKAQSLPHVVTRLERHPFSAQSFVPLEGGHCLAIVCPSLEDGSPDLQHMRAFVVEPTVGITYRRNVWHHSVIALSAPSQWLVLMGRTGLNDDNVFWPLETAIEVAVR